MKKSNQSYRCGLVERSGQGMNLIYEQAVREAKPLPHFQGSDDYCVKLTLELKVIHPKMLALMKQIGEEKLDVMSTDDYLLLSAIFREEDLRNTDPARFNHLIELEIVKYSEHGIGPANGGVVLAIRTLSEPSSDKVPINGSDKEQAMINFMAERDFVTTAELAELLGVSQRTVLKMFKKLEEKDFKAVKSGSNRDAKYKLQKI